MIEFNYSKYMWDFFSVARMYIAKLKFKAINKKNHLEVYAHMRQCSYGAVDVN